MRVKGMLAAAAVGLALASPASARVNDDGYFAVPPSPNELFWNDEPFGQDGLAQQTPAPQPAAPATEPAAPTDSSTTPAPDESGQQDPEGVLPDLEGPPSDDEMSVGEIPSVETIELTPDMAKKALDAYIVVRDKYKDAELENYENLQDFVEQAPQGKAFEADIKTIGFASVNEWNVAITMVGFAYSNILDDQSDDIRQQIEEVKQDTEMAQDMRDRMVQALQAMIPSDNNKKIVEDLLKDPIYGEKIKQLENEEE
jgi:hypothetical protein